MKAPKFFVVGLITLVAVAVLAQTNFPSRWSPVSWQFQINGAPHVARIEHRAVLAAKPWQPSKPLPLSPAAVEQIARKELRKLVQDEGVWEVIGFAG